MAQRYHLFLVFWKYNFSELIIFYKQLFIKYKQILYCLYLYNGAKNCFLDLMLFF